MNQRREDLSTADLASQPPRDTTPSDLADDADVERPAPAAVGEPAAERTPAAGAPGPTAAGQLLAADDAERFRARWTDVQNGLVDAPRQAVEQADGLVAEVMQHLARTFSEERGRLERQWDRGDEVSTDDLRTAFQHYRSFSSASWRPDASTT
jgi:hypothetical protein